MDRIEVKILNPGAIAEAETMINCCARLTQRGHKIQNLSDFMEIYHKGEGDSILAQSLVSLPHPALQKFSVINVVVVGASRRFLAQITRHQNEVKFMSASLQYSDYSGKAAFVVPYEIMDTPREKAYLKQCEASMEKYRLLIDSGVDNDTAGYLVPHGLRNVLVISATPYQWKHMISQRVCHRNTPETRYVMLLIWQELFKENPALFSGCGPFCMQEHCKEGKMSCGKGIVRTMTPKDILEADFPKLCV